MSIVRTDAMVLRIVPYSRTSQIVTWLSPDHGQITTLIKGACRPKSMFLGQYDLFSTCELLYYARTRSSLHIARSATLITPRDTFRHNWRATALASYMADLASRVSVSGDHQAEIYILTQQALDGLVEGGADTALVFRFELALCRALGMAPQLTQCITCHQAPPRAAPVFLSVPEGGILCHNCCNGPDARTHRLSPDVLAILRKWLHSPLPDTAHIRCTREQLLAFRRTLGIFVHYHLGVPTRAREIALNLVNMRAA